MNRLPVIVRQHIAGFRILLVFTVICGFVYPLVMLGIGQVAFHNQANGSLVATTATWWAPACCARSSWTPRATRCRSTSSRGPRTRSVSGGQERLRLRPARTRRRSNLGPTNPIADPADIKQRQQADRRVRPRPGLGDPGGRGDRVGSGPRPRHLAANADIQVDRVAAARHLPASEVRAWSPQYHRPDARLPWRAHGQRAHVEHRCSTSCPPSPAEPSAAVAEPSSVSRPGASRPGDGGSLPRGETDRDSRRRGPAGAGPRAADQPARQAVRGDGRADRAGRRWPWPRATRRTRSSSTSGCPTSTAPR